MAGDNRRGPSAAISLFAGQIRSLASALGLPYHEPPGDSCSLALSSPCHETLGGFYSLASALERAGVLILEDGLFCG
jgi:hypothetical protein